MRRPKAILVVAVVALGIRILLAHGQSDVSAVQEINRGVSPPKVIFQPEPEYSDKARLAGYEGICTLALIVEADGTPSHIRVIKSLGMGLDEQAIEAVRAWRFQPALKQGKPVAVQLAVEVDFHLSAKAVKMAQLRKDATAGQPKAELELAEEYLEGKDLPKDEHEGMTLLEKASNQGLAQAQFKLAQRMTHAASPDYPKIYLWYTLAQRGGEKHSAKELRKLAAQMTPDQVQAGKVLVGNWSPTKN